MKEQKFVSCVKIVMINLMCVVFIKKNMHAFDKQTRKLLSAVTLSRLLP